MKVRLGFSVAAHLEPEILIIDEVLAVGDFDFQKKCLNKMQDVGKQGRTVLFVSHNMQAVTRLCSRAILLEEGRIKYDGASSEVVAKYMTTDSGLTAERIWNGGAKAPGAEVARLCAVRVHDEDGNVSNSFDIRKPIGIQMEYEVLKSGYLLLPHHNVFNEEGGWIFTTFDTDQNWQGKDRPAGKYKATAWIPGNFLSEGLLFIHTVLFTLKPRTIQFSERDVVSFQVIDKLEGNTARGDWSGPIRGAVRPLLRWTNGYEKLK
jgi:lipopolysaccharide transport system ATP-binding protein